MFSSYLHQGQICIRANTVIVDAAVHDDFVARFVERARALRVGDPKDPETRIGPTINAGQLKSIQDKVSRSVDAGAQLLLSGEPTGPAGLALPPHVVSGRNDVPTAAEEVFGPVATIVRVDGESDALELANQTRYGLSSSVFTQDFDRGLRFAHQVQAGMTHINDTTVNYEPNTAFGGEKDSGGGRFGGRLGDRDVHPRPLDQRATQPSPLRLLTRRRSAEISRCGAPARGTAGALLCGRA